MKIKDEIVKAQANEVFDEDNLKETFIQNGVVKVKLLNLRKKASKNSAVVTVMHEGESVEIHEECNDWYKITASNGMQGFCMKEFITVK